MKRKAFESEAELATHVVSWLEADGWDVYQEVPLMQSGNCPDIVAVRLPVVWIIECKTSFGLSVIEQAHYWLRCAHFRSVAVPRTRDQAFGKEVAKKFGVGVLTVMAHAATGTARIEEAVHPEFNRKARGSWVLAKLKPEHKTFAKAGSVSGARFTPYRDTCEKVRRAVETTPGITMKELMTAVQTHYASVATARSTLARRIEDNQVPGVRIEREGRIIKLYPMRESRG